MSDETDEFEKKMMAYLSDRTNCPTELGVEYSLLHYRELKPKLLNEASRYLSKRICDLSEENEKLKQSREQILNNLLNDEKAIIAASQSIIEDYRTPLTTSQLSKRALEAAIKAHLKPEEKEGKR